MSRIYYEGKFYSYPLRAFEALWNLGIFRSTLCMVSYAQAKLLPNKNVRSFEDWTINQFGRKLYSIFFKTYTEKVWGMPCDEMSADWAAQRIKGLSLGGAVIDGLKRSLGLNKRPNDGMATKTLPRNLSLSAAGPRHDVGRGARQGRRGRQPCADGPQLQACSRRIRRRAAGG